MATGLSAQLERLRVPQTRTLLDVDYRKSVLFSAKEAAEKDRRTIYDIGVQGLQELILLNPCFQQFESTLFEENTLHLERSVELSEVNELLDQNINKFLMCLSPYFMLRPAQMCIEWLLRRFYISDYNTSALMMLILPYHDTKLFVRALQTISLRHSDAKTTADWAWLRKLQRSGLCVPHAFIANHAASLPSFLQLICNHTCNVVKEFGANGHLAQAHINLYATIVIGALESASVVQEKHILAILPSLLQALNSKTPDFVSAAFVIIAELLSRTQITAKLCNAFVHRLCTSTFKNLHATAAILLNTIFEKQEAAKMVGSLKDAHTDLLNCDWLIEMLSKICMENIDISPLSIYLLKSTITDIQNNTEEIKSSIQFLERFLEDITLPSIVARKYISCFLDMYKEPKKRVHKMSTSDVIDLGDSDDENNTNFKTWYSNYLYKLQRQYPNEFDQTIKDTFQLKNAQSSNRRLALNMAIGVHLKFADENLITLYESIYHHTANMRLMAIETLITNVSDYKTRPKCYELLKQCLADRLCNEDNETVLAALLKLPVKDFIDILGINQYIDALITIVHKSEANSKQWLDTIELVIEHLTCDIVVEQCNLNIILLALMPLILSSDANSMEKHIATIVKSPLINRAKFLKELNTKHAKTKGEFNTSEFKKHFSNILASSNTTPTVQELMQSINGREKMLFKTSSHFSHFVILLTGYLKHRLDCKETAEIFEYFSKTYESLNVSNYKTNNAQPIEMCLSKDLIRHFLVKLINLTTFQNVSNWSDMQATELLCFMRIFEWLVNHAIQEKQIAERIGWIKLLQEIINLNFNDEIEKVDFLTNFYLYNDFINISNFDVLRLIAFKVLDHTVAIQQIELSTEHILKIFTALSSPSETLRLKALNTLKESLSATRASWKQFLELILARSYEIGIDEEQFSLVLYTILKTQQKKQLNVDKIFSDIFKVVQCSQTITNAVLIAEVLHMLRHINNVEIFSEFMPLAEIVLDKNCNDDGVQMLQMPYNRIYEMILERLDYQTIKEALLLQNTNAWSLIEKSLQRHDVFVKVDEKLHPLPCLLLNAFDEQIYDELPNKYKILLVKEIIKTIANAENDEIFLTANKFLKKCTIVCEPFDDILKCMYNVKSESNTITTGKSKPSAAAAKRLTAITQLDINGSGWKQGVALLELLDNKKKLENAHKLIPTLFELLRHCVTAEEQARIEYAKQLTLSALNHFIRTSESLQINLQSELPQSVFRVDQIVQCLRSTQNPQTQNNSLQLLSTCANIFPEQVLHNIVDMFTFMGSSVVRQEDAFSYDIITNIIETIVPILVIDTKKHKTQTMNGDDKQVLVISVLKVFSDIILDVPEHRRIPLYTKLLETLSAEEYLWIFLCIVFEAHVIDVDKRNAQKKRKLKNIENTDEAKRIQIVLELMNNFKTPVILGTCFQLMQYIRSMPLNKEDAMEIDANAANNTEITLFDVNCRTSKQLRHYKYVIMQFLSTATSAVVFLEKVALLNDSEILEMKPYYQNYIIAILSFVPIVNDAINSAAEPSLQKYWKIILNHLHDILENAISLLSPNMFLDVVIGLMKHKVLSIRRKVVELLITKLQRKDEYFDKCDQAKFQILLQPLIDILDTILTRDDEDNSVGSGNDIILLQQNALIATKLLSKRFAFIFMTEFKEILNKLTKMLKKRNNISKILLATGVLAIVDVSCNLKAHSLVFIPKYMPQLIEVLQDQEAILEKQPPDSICLSIITAIYKIVEALPLFLAPFIKDIILVISVLMERISKSEHKLDQRSANAQQKMLAIWKKLATDVPLRVLIPCCADAYDRLIETKSYNEIAPLMQLINETLDNSNSNDLSAMQKEVTSFFMKAVKFRLHIEGEDLATIDHNTIESHIITAFTVWVLKLSESSFRPLYHSVYDWAFKQAKNNKLIVLVTFFRLTTKLADALKSLFIVFSNNLIEAIAKLLKEHQMDTLPIEDNEVDLHSDLLMALLNTLHMIFLYDNKKFINAQRFAMIMQPLVDQLENSLVLTNDGLQNIVSNCIAQLAVAVSSDVLWKQLNYQVLLKTRTNVPEVRILAFECCIEIARKLGDDFTSLLPETVPFIAELFEDENPRVEKSTRKLVHDLEGILGESIQKYL